MMSDLGPDQSEPIDPEQTLRCKHCHIWVHPQLHEEHKPGCPWYAFDEIAASDAVYAAGPPEETP